MKTRFVAVAGTLSTAPAVVAEGPKAQDTTNEVVFNPRIAALGDGQAVRLETNDLGVPAQG